MALLDIQNLCVQFGGLRALTDFSMEVELGQLAGLIGPNGAGKTTIFNAITGIVRPSGGKIFFDDKEITALRPDLVAHRGISRTFQNIRLFSKLTAVENVEIAIHRKAQYSAIEAFFRTPRVRRIDRETHQKALEYLDSVGLLEYEKSVAGELPYGIQRRLEIARAIATQPKLLLLDEPAAGMNNEETAALGDFITQLYGRHGTKLTILLIEHHLDFVMSLCQNITVLNLGGKLFSGNAEQVQNDPQVIKAYIGERRVKK